MRRWLTGAVCAVTLLGAGLTGAGCGGDDAPVGTFIPPVASREPAESAGGACQLFDYDVIKAQLGIDFDIAASGNVDATYTCVLQQTESGVPDLSLAVTATEADNETFKKTVTPKGSASVSGLGKIAYSSSVAAGSGAGPGLEVGWLSGNQRLIVLRYRSANGTAGGDVNALLPKLVALAKQIDLSTA
ncbi:hypothetical protein [Rugosimonospora africana]|uniref:DUF3558 domain-containing protein n=1 Tax=Rugosimonospora africana TaxID=556532 RepID=A0A8J3QP35_9ACTN|nr:hypothetical protein [Rugosimonospora africana]GIH13759.1 hypothetical protein Raf01_19310 [Rugosimonospora africana]